MLKWDVTYPLLLDRQVDIVLMVFALSAIHPRNHLSSLLNINDKLSNGSYLLFRDYGIHDMTMYRHTIRHEENLYERSDGTLSYYFDIEYFTSLAREAHFQVIEMKYATVINRNRKTRVEMKRVFLHAVLQKVSDGDANMNSNVIVENVNKNDSVDVESKNNEIIHQNII